jgi:NAD-dependent deacetylase
MFPPHCPECEELARPNVVWFGETLDQSILEASFECASKANTMLVIGTSAIVHPAAQIPLVAQANGARIIEINPEETPLSIRADEVYPLSAEKGLSEWLRDHRYEF